MGLLCVDLPSDQANADFFTVKYFHIYLDNDKYTVNLKGRLLRMWELFIISDTVAVSPFLFVSLPGCQIT